MRGRVAWVVLAAIVVGWLVVPQAVSAVGSLVTIQNSSGSQKAGVTKAQQLQTAEAAPSTFREFEGSTSDNQCHVLTTIPSTKGFVIRTVSLNMILASSGGLEVFLLFPNGTCTGHDLFSASTHALGTHSVSIDPGFAIAPGRELSYESGGTGGDVAVYVWGYLVPKGDVANTTPIG